MLSSYQIETPDFYNIPVDHIKKLVHNFFDKEKFVLHYENLQLTLRLWLKLKKIHHILKFNQSQ